MLKYFIPFYYTIHSRSKGIHFLSYFLMVLIPSFFILMSNDFLIFDCKLCVLYFIAFTGMLSIYEIGYIWNDAICIKKDPNPTKRINDEEINFLSKKIWPITIAKIIVSIAVVILLSNFREKYFIILYEISLLLLLIIYIIHNHFRNWINYITVFLLTTLNYSCTLFLLSDEKYLLFNIVSVLILFSMPKCFFYVLRKINKNKIFNEGYNFGFYYLFCTLIAVVLYFICNVSILLVILPAYMAVYRIGINFLKTRGKK